MGNGRGIRVRKGLGYGGIVLGFRSEWEAGCGRAWGGSVQEKE